MTTDQRKYGRTCGIKILSHIRIFDQEEQKQSSGSRNDYI